MGIDYVKKLVGMIGFVMVTRQNTWQTHNTVGLSKRQDGNHLPKQVVKTNAKYAILVPSFSYISVIYGSMQHSLLEEPSFKFRSHMRMVRDLTDASYC